MDTDCRWPGSCHDAKISANSSSVNKAIQDKLQMLFKKVLPGKERTPTYLFCDPTYPLKVYCKKKFESSKSNARVIFSSMLSLARNPTEGGFGRLKAMCKILAERIYFKLENVTKIVTYFALHSFYECRKNFINKNLVLFNNYLHAE